MTRLNYLTNPSLKQTNRKIDEQIPTQPLFLSISLLKCLISTLLPEPAAKYEHQLCLKPITIWERTQKLRSHSPIPDCTLEWPHKWESRMSKFRRREQAFWLRARSQKTRSNEWQLQATGAFSDLKTSLCPKEEILDSLVTHKLYSFKTWRRCILMDSWLLWSPSLKRAQIAPRFHPLTNAEIPNLKHKMRLRSYTMRLKM